MTRRLADIRGELEDDFRARLPEADVSVGTENRVRFIETRALANLGLYGEIARVERDLFPDTASTAGLDRWGTIKGLPRKPAEGARGTKALRVVGEPGGELAGDELLAHGPSSQRFRVMHPATIGPGGFVDVDVAAVDAGRRTSLAAGEVLAFVSPPAGIQAEAELQARLEGGSDRESDDAYRARLLRSFADPPSGGQASDYEQEALKEPGITAAYVYPLRDGVGTVDIAATHAGSGTARFLTAEERAGLLARLQDFAPLGAVVRVLETVAREVTVEVAIRDLFDRWDWNDAEPLMVAGWVAESRTLVLDRDRPGDMQPGDRLAIAGTGGELLRVDGFGAAANQVILQAVPSGEVRIGERVYAGGDLVEPVRAAVRSQYFDALGPARGRYARGSWQATVSPSQLAASLAVALGSQLADIQVLAPAASVTPHDPAPPANHTIELAVPTRILVRRLHDEEENP